VHQAAFAGYFYVQLRADTLFEVKLYIHSGRVVVGKQGMNSQTQKQ